MSERLHALGRVKKILQQKQREWLRECYAPLREALKKKRSG